MVDLEGRVAPPPATPTQGQVSILQFVEGRLGFFLPQTECDGGHSQCYPIQRDCAAHFAT
ncbi:MAG: hypothetical protein R3B13_25120 [Polyangiaceae bacterium]